MKTYDPKDWYWFVAGDTSKVFSSAADAYVSPASPAYLAWKADGAHTIAIDTEANLDTVLEPYRSRPTSVTPRQARLALLQYGLLDQVEALVAQVGGATKITWEYALVIERSDPLIETLRGGLGLLPAAVDQLFRTASTL